MHVLYRYLDPLGYRWGPGTQTKPELPSIEKRESSIYRYVDPRGYEARIWRYSPAAKSLALELTSRAHTCESCVPMGMTCNDTSSRTATTTTTTPHRPAADSAGVVAAAVAAAS